MKSRVALAIVIFVQLLAAIALADISIYRTYHINGQAMSNTLVDGEVVSAELYASDDELRRGDVIICLYPGRGNTVFVKRLVGLPGDAVEMKDQHLYVNGKQIADPEKMNLQPGYDFREYLLKEDEYFVLGDNRGNSNDSHSIGPIKRSMIIAHVTAVIWPLNKIRTVENEFVTVAE